MEQTSVPKTDHFLYQEKGGFTMGLRNPNPAFAIGSTMDELVPSTGARVELTARVNAFLRHLVAVEAWQPHMNSGSY